jgi:hypothetical protein
LSTASVTTVDEIDGSAVLFGHDIAGHPLPRYPADNSPETMRKIGVRGIHIQRTPVVVICRNCAGPEASIVKVIRKPFGNVVDFLVADQLIGIMRNRRFFG